MGPDSTPPTPSSKPAKQPADPASGSGREERKKPSAWAQVARYSAIGMIIPSHLFAGWLLGTILDRVFSTSYLDTVFVLVGMVSGFIEMIRIASRDPD
jgi:F0F1-type ATP synthase assembly protein I